VRIQTRDYGTIKFTPLGTQTFILDQLEDGIAHGISSFNFLKGRQIGASQIFKLIDFFYAFEYRGLLGTFIIHEEKALDKWRNDLEQVYDMMPKTVINSKGERVKFKPPIIKHNRNILVFGNGSSFSYLTAGTGESKQGGLGRSQASNFVHGTETAFYGNPDDLAAFQSSVSDIYPYRLQVHESTANRFNHFYDSYQQGLTSPTTRSIFVGWWLDERKQFHARDPRFGHYGKDRPNRLELGRIRAVKEKHGYDISMQQLAWYRWKLEDPTEFAGDQTRMDAEFPFTDDDAFQSTGSKYYTAPVLNDITRAARKNPMQVYKYNMTKHWEDTHVVGPLTDPRSELKIWEHASRFGVYIVSCDGAYCSSDDADNTVIQVWRAYAECIEQVAEYCSNDISTYQAAWVIAHLAGFYGKKECRVILELNGPGKAIFAELEHLREHLREMPNNNDFVFRNCLNNMSYYYYSRIDTMTTELAYHWITTDDNKRFIMSGLKNAIELSRVDVRSLALIEELKTLKNEDGSIEAEGGKNDDRVMAAALAHEMWRRWMWARLRGERLTRARSAEIEHRGGEQPIDRVVINYLKTCNIQVPT
jgi:hypothetical protein